MSDNNEGDTIIILSSELISNVMEEHFNKHMFKKGVKVTDLQPSEKGYVFVIAFEEKAKKVNRQQEIESSLDELREETNGWIPERNEKGQFVRGGIDGTG